MEQFQLADSYLVEVPGSVLSALCDTGAIGEQYQDPYYRDNEYALRELFWQDTGLSGILKWVRNCWKHRR